MAIEVSFKLNAEGMGESFAETFDLLDEEDKKEIMKDIFLEWLRSPEDFERIKKEREVIDDLRSDYSHKNDTEEQIRKGYKFKEKMSEFTSTKEKMVEQVIKNISERYDEIITEHVENDEQAQAMFDKMVEEFDNNLADMLQHYMVKVMVSSHMEKLRNIENAAMNNTFELDDLKTQLNVNQF